jgi:hypothetical protein
MTANLPSWWANPARATVTWPGQLDSTGMTGPTRGQAQRGLWRRTSHGWYVRSAVPVTVEQRIAEARPLLLDESAAVTGWAALRWLGAAWSDGTAPDGQRPLDVDVVTNGRHARPHRGFRISAARLPQPGGAGVVDGLRITSPVRAVCFQMQNALDLRRAVEQIDVAAYNDLVSIAEVAEHVSKLTGRRGVRQCRAAVELATENAWSPREVGFRLVWELDAGLPRPLCNVPLFDRGGNLIGTPDLLDLEAGVVGEYDGALHLQGAQRARDVRREALFRNHGLEYVTMLAGDLPDPSGVVRRIHEARSRARFSTPDERTWTEKPPPWWTPTGTVAQRRALTDLQRKRFLGSRLRAA